MRVLHILIFSMLPLFVAAELLKHSIASNSAITSAIGVSAGGGSKLWRRATDEERIAARRERGRRYRARKKAQDPGSFKKLVADSSKRYRDNLKKERPDVYAKQREAASKRDKERRLKAASTKIARNAAAGQKIKDKKETRGPDAWRKYRAAASKRFRDKKMRREGSDRYNEHRAASDKRFKDNVVEEEGRDVYRKYHSEWIQRWRERRRKEDAAAFREKTRAARQRHRERYPEKYGGYATTEEQRQRTRAWRRTKMADPVHRQALKDADWIRYRINAGDPVYRAKQRERIRKRRANPDLRAKEYEATKLRKKKAKMEKPKEEQLHVEPLQSAASKNIDALWSAEYDYLLESSRRSSSSSSSGKSDQDGSLTP